MAYVCMHSASPVRPVVDIYVPEEAIYSEPFNMTCRATTGASQLFRYLVIEWVSVDGQSISEEDGVTIEPQQSYSDTATRSLIFDSLEMAHGGTYKCVASLLLPDSAVSFNTSAEHHINVLSKYLRFHDMNNCYIYYTDRTLIQLRFGPVVHCSKWYEDKVNTHTTCHVVIVQCISPHRGWHNTWREISRRHWQVSLIRTVVVVSKPHR